MKEIFKKINNTKGYGFIKFYLWTKIARIVSSKKNSLSNETWVNLKFNYWNPLTYIYLILTFIVACPLYLVDSGLKNMLKQAKEELVNGWGFWLK